MATTTAPEQQTLVPTVAKRAEACFTSFQQCLNEAAAIHPRELSLVEDQLARFSLWSSNIRVFVSGRGSLDYRLREAPDVQDAVSGLLEALGYRVQDCSRIISSLSSRTPDNALEAIDERLDQALQRIANEISLLHRFSNTIRRASKEKQNDKAAEAFIIEDDEGNNAEPFLQALFTNHIRDRFPDASDIIQQRLASTMLMRRKRILYRRSRYGKSIIRTQEVPSQPSIVKPQAQAAIQLPGEPVKRGMVTTVPNIAAQSVVRTATTLSPESFQRASSPSVVSVSKTVALNSHEEIRFPPAPCGGLKRKYKKLKQEREKQYKGDLELIPRQTEPSDTQRPSLFGMTRAREAKYKETLANDWNECLRSMPEISCPYCFCALPVEDVVSEKKWSSHVMGDLDPYVCMFQECDSPQELYSHGHTWLKHMGEHARRWRCASKSHGEFVCGTRDEYLTHMKVAHTGKFTDAQLAVLADRNGRIVGPMFQSCPLCGIKEVDGSIEHHLVGHMRFLAIKSLPSYEEDTDGLHEPGSQESSLAISRPETRSTIRNEKDVDWGIDSDTDWDEAARRANELNESELPEHQHTHESASDSQFLDVPGIGLRLREWDFVPSTRGSSPPPDDPVIQALGRRRNNKKKIIKLDPDCAICHAQEPLDCYCEAEYLDTAVMRAEQRVMGPVYAKIRSRVRELAHDFVLRDFQKRQEQLKKPTTDSQEEEESGPAKRNLEHRSREITNENWQKSVQRYPEALDCFFELVGYTVPPDDDPSVRNPRIYHKFSGRRPTLPGRFPSY